MKTNKTSTRLLGMVLKARILKWFTISISWGDVNSFGLVTNGRQHGQAFFSNLEGSLRFGH